MDQNEAYYIRLITLLKRDAPHAVKYVDRKGSDLIRQVINNNPTNEDLPGLANMCLSMVVGINTLYPIAKEISPLLEGRSAVHPLDYLDFRGVPTNVRDPINFLKSPEWTNEMHAIIQTLVKEEILRVRHDLSFDLELLVRIIGRPASTEKYLREVLVNKQMEERNKAHAMGSVKEIADKLGISIAAVRKAKKDGTLDKLIAESETSQ